MPRKKSGKKKTANKKQGEKPTVLKVQKDSEQKINAASAHNKFTTTPQKEKEYTDASFWRQEIAIDDLEDLDDLDDDITTSSCKFSGSSSSGSSSNSSSSSSSSSSSDTIKVVVGSTNPVKVNSVLAAFKEVFPTKKVEAVGVAASSGVSDQPMSEKETKQGSINRATAAVEAIKKTQPDFGAHYAVGLEGGLEVSSKESITLYDCFAWMAVYEIKTSKFSYARTASFTLPRKVCELVSQGMELGVADDQVFRRHNSKQSDGTVGILTHGLIDRTCYYKHALLFALVPLMNPDLY